VEDKDFVSVGEIASFMCIIEIEVNRLRRMSKKRLKLLRQLRQLLHKMLIVYIMYHRKKCIIENYGNL
jgi:hypothetical protein